MPTRKSNTTDNDPELVWYVSYGSNLRRERFMHYIEGGRYRLARNTLPGCTDTTPPRDVRAVVLNYPIYFGGRSSTWGGGVAFIDPEAEGETLARAYLITRQQFCQIVAQESANVDGKVGLTPADLPMDASGISGNGCYDRMVHCGELDGWPMLTFTSPTRHTVTAKPTAEYLQTIGEGLAESHGLDAAEIASYLICLEGAGDHAQNDVHQLLSATLSLGTPAPSKSDLQSMTA